MPKGPQGQKRPADVIGNAQEVRPLRKVGGNFKLTQCRLEALVERGLAPLQSRQPPAHDAIDHFKLPIGIDFAGQRIQWDEIDEYLAVGGRVGVSQLP